MTTKAQTGHTPRLAVHRHELTRIVLADWIETTVARTHCGMFSDKQNVEHAAMIVDRVNAHDQLVDALRAMLDWAKGKPEARINVAIDVAEAALRAAGEEELK